MNDKMLKKLADYTVLYAEDDEVVRKNVSEMLSLLFKKVFVAKDGIEAYDMFINHTPSIVITDVQMPHLSGIELTKKIRKKDKSLPIIIISAHTEVDYMLDAIELSLIKYIVKPITQTKLFEALKRFLEIQNDIALVKLVDGWTYDSDNKMILNANKEYELSKKESKLLELLLSKKSVLTYEEIELELWEDEYMSLNALRLMMKNFRKKLPKGYLKNIQSVGYKL